MQVPLNIIPNQTHLIESFILLPAIRAPISLWLGSAISTALQAIRELVDEIASGKLGEDLATLEDLAHVFQVAGGEIVHPVAGFKWSTAVL
jgi:hypothetical protein